MLPEKKLQQLNRISASTGGNIVTAQDLLLWSEKDIQQFEKEEVLLFRGYVDSIRCDRCHKSCSVNPQIARYPDGQQKGVVLCTDEDEGGRIEFEMKKLRYWEINKKKLQDNGYPPTQKEKTTSDPSTSLKLTGDSFITFAEAAEIIGVAKGTISKWVKKGWFQDNGQKGQKRRLLKSSVLLVKQKIEDADLKRDVQELRQDARQLPIDDGR
jgi:hypothetical protein